MDIIQKIIDNFNNYPDRIAFHCSDKAGGDKEITWRELGEKAFALSGFLSDFVMDNKPVVVVGHKHPLMIVCFLATVFSGRAYCPIDTSTPKLRIKAILDSLVPGIVLNVSDIKLNDIYNGEILDFEAVDKYSSHTSKSGRVNPVKYNEVFYIIFTSGSTGKPKGVQITTECLNNFIKWGLTWGHGIEETAHNVFFNTAPFSFDLSVMDLYLSLYTGGTLWSVDRGCITNIKYLTHEICISEAGIIVATPSFINMCMADRGFTEDNFRCLRSFYFCGETLPRQLVVELYNRFPSAEVVNSYGPTESTVAISAMTISKDILKRNDILPIGYIKPGTSVIIDRKNKTDETGEIIIVGDTVSIGYIGDDENNTKFGTVKIDGKEYRSYRTGDRGYIIDDVLHFCGRIDSQIKVNGYRMEIEDIENNLMRVEGVRRAAVVPIYSKDNDVRYLKGYILPDPSYIGLSERIKEDVSKYLPKYMIPKKIEFIDNIPLTSNGKVDRKKLGEI